MSKNFLRNTVIFVKKRDDVYDRIRQLAKEGPAAKPKIASFLGGLEDGLKSLLDSTPMVVYNASDRPIYIKDATSNAVIKVEGNDFVVQAYDGIASWNQSKGSIAKCPDLNIGIVFKDGSVNCYGPRRDYSVGSEPLWDDKGTDGADWDNLKKKANEIRVISSSRSSSPGEDSGSPNDRNPPNNDNYEGDTDFGPSVDNIA